jgi:Arm DNA-binding domain
MAIATLIGRFNPGLSGRLAGSRGCPSRFAIRSMLCLFADTPPRPSAFRSHALALRPPGLAPAATACAVCTIKRQEAVGFWRFGSTWLASRRRSGRRGHAISRPYGSGKQALPVLRYIPPRGIIFKDRRPASPRRVLVPSAGRRRYPALVTPCTVASSSSASLLLIGRNGARSWIFRYKFHKRRHEMGLGGFPMISLAEARELAKGYRRQLHDGFNPLEQRRAQRQAAKLEAAKRIPFKQCAETYIAETSPAWKNRKHAAQWSLQVTQLGRCGETTSTIQSFTACSITHSTVGGPCQAGVKPP